MSDDDIGMKTQRELLYHELLESLAREGSRREYEMLAFDEALCELLEEAGHSITFVEPEGPLPTKRSYDLVIGVGFLERTSDDREALLRVCRSLSTGGAVLIAVPLARAGREPPEGSLRGYSAFELSSAILRAGLMPTQLLADGPELLVCECAPSTEVGAEVVSTVATHVAAGRWSEAEATLAAISAQMEDEELVREYAMLVGHVHLASGHLGPALEAFNEAANLATPSVLPLTAMGAVAITASDFQSASEIFSAALELCPTHFSALRGMGIVQESLGDNEGALTSYDMAATQRPMDREITEKVVTLAVAAGKAQPALHAIERHVRHTSDNQWAARLVETIEQRGHSAYSGA